MGDFQYWKQTFNEMVYLASTTKLWTIEICNVKPNQRGWKSFTQHNAFGKYRCPNCHKQWESIHSVIEFYIQVTDWQGRVMMKPMGQQCKKCNNHRYVKPKMPNRIIRIIVQNLMKTIRKKCFGEYNQQLYPADDGKIGHGTHIKELCEACHLGICKAEAINRQQSSNVEQCHVYIREDKPNTPLNSTQQHDSCKMFFCVCLFAIILLVIAKLLCYFFSR